MYSERQNDEIFVLYWKAAFAATYYQTKVSLKSATFLQKFHMSSHAFFT